MNLDISPTIRTRYQSLRRPAPVRHHLSVQRGRTPSRRSASSAKRMATTIRGLRTWSKPRRASWPLTRQALSTSPPRVIARRSPPWFNNDPFIRTSNPSHNPQSPSLPHAIMRRNPPQPRNTFNLLAQTPGSYHELPPLSLNPNPRNLGPCFALCLRLRSRSLASFFSLYSSICIDYC